MMTVSNAPMIVAMTMARMVMICRQVGTSSRSGKSNSRNFSSSVSSSESATSGATECRHDVVLSMFCTVERRGRVDRRGSKPLFSFWGEGAG